MFASAYLCVVLLACVGFAPTQSARTGLNAVVDLNDEYVAAVESGNKDALLSLYHKNAIYLPDGAPAVTGKTALSEERGSLEGIGSIDYTIVELRWLDEDRQWVLERMNYETHHENGQLLFRGKNVLIWKKVGNTFKLFLEMFNDNSK